MARSHPCLLHYPNRGLPVDQNLRQVPRLRLVGLVPPPDVALLLASHLRLDHDLMALCLAPPYDLEERDLAALSLVVLPLASAPNLLWRLVPKPPTPLYPALLWGWWHNQGEDHGMVLRLGVAVLWKSSSVAQKWPRMGVGR